MDIVFSFVLIVAGMAILFHLLAYLLSRWATGPFAFGLPAAEPGASGEREEKEKPLTARLVVGERESALHLPDGRTVRIPYGDYRALGEAGRYLLPGAVLVVAGMNLDEAARTAGHLLEVMGAKVVWEGE
ncbi:hypothetical protein [Fervidobacterium sp.]